MKKSSVRIWCAVAGLAVLATLESFSEAQTPQPAVKPPPTTAPGADPGPGPTPEQISYLIGLIFGAQLHGMGIQPESLTPDALVRGVNEGLQGKTPNADDQRQLQNYARAASDAMAAKNASAAKDFLARNGKEKGVVTTASGLQYKILVAGDKKAPAIGPTDSVTVEYRGKLLNGTEFDSSYSTGKPATAWRSR